MRFSRMALLLSGIGFATLSLSWCFAFFVGDPHIFARGGAIVAAYSAMLVVWQVYQEILLEDQREPARSASQRAEEVRLSAAIGAAHVKELIMKEKKLQETRRHRLRRLQIVGLVAGMAAVGELIHGLGDYLVPGAVHGEWHDEWRGQEKAQNPVGEPGTLTRNDLLSVVTGSPSIDGPDGG